MYTSKKLGSEFNIKDATKKQHCFDLVYKAKCPAEGCNATYIGEVGRRFLERIHDHNGKDKKSHVFQHAVKSKHPNVDIHDFSILNKGFRNNTFKRRVSEALFIKELKPSLNAQVKSVPLKLLN